MVVEKTKKVVDSVVEEVKVRSELQARKESFQKVVIEKIKEVVDKLVKEAKVRSEQQVEGASTWKVIVEKTEKFVVSAMLCVRKVAFGVLGSLFHPEQLFDKHRSGS